jgi:hypothetical protein
MVLRVVKLTLGVGAVGMLGAALASGQPGLSFIAVCLAAAGAGAEQLQTALRRRAEARERRHLEAERERLEDAVLRLTGLGLIFDDELAAAYAESLSELASIPPPRMLAHFQLYTVLTGTLRRKISVCDELAAHPDLTPLLRRLAERLQGTVDPGLRREGQRLERIIELARQGIRGAMLAA